MPEFSNRQLCYIVGAILLLVLIIGLITLVLPVKIELLPDGIDYTAYFVKVDTIFNSYSFEIYPWTTEGNLQRLVLSDTFSINAFVRYPNYLIAILFMMAVSAIGLLFNSVLIWRLRDGNEG